MRRCALLTVAVLGCAPSEVPRVELAVGTRAEPPVVVALSDGTRLTLQRLRVAVRDFEFALRGEAHTASVGALFERLAMARARAHPGHTQAGEVTGVLAGRYVLELGVDEVLGRGTLLTGAYESANLTFDRGELGDGDPLDGHTFDVAGELSRDGRAIAFEGVFDAPEGRELIGVPFVHSIEVGTGGTLGWGLAPESLASVEAVDLEALDPDLDGRVQLAESGASPAVVDFSIRLRRVLMTHDPYRVVLVGGE